MLPNLDNQQCPVDGLSGAERENRKSTEIKVGWVHHNPTDQIASPAAYQSTRRAWPSYINPSREGKPYRGCTCLACSSVPFFFYEWPRMK